MEWIIKYALSFTILFICTEPIKSKSSVTLKSAQDTADPHTAPLYKTVVFNAGDDLINSFRIPSLTTTKKGSLLLFCEARKIRWKDKSPTDIALKRSIDNGKSWSKMKIIAKGGNNAFMDPCAIVDKATGRIFLFATQWPQNDHSGFKNTAWIMTSDDDGKTWSEPQNITEQITAPGHFIDGFGPGSGLQMAGKSTFSNRLIIPTRQKDKNNNARNRSIYSDDHGITWKVGEGASGSGEYQIAESPFGTLIYNRRNDSTRMVARSADGGVTWSAEKIDTALISVSKGCEGSVLGANNILFHTGPSGCISTDTTDNRANLIIYRSTDGGLTWKNKYNLFDKAAGYSCITRLMDGRFAIAFETADTNGFIRMPGTRPAGWMRIDIIILPKEIGKKEYWLN